MGGIPLGDVLGGHRIVVAQGAALTLQLLDDLQAATAEAAPDDGAEEGGLARAAALHKRVAALRDLVPKGVEGAIVGKALYAKAFTLAEALAVASR